MLIICNISLLSAQETTTATMASNITTEPTYLTSTSTSFAKAPVARKAVAARKSYFRFGERVVALARFSTTDEQPYVLLSLHHNEYTASEGARKFVSEQGGTYLELQNNNERNIEFTLFDKDMTVDPDNIFTPKGRWNDLSANLKKDHIISQQIAEFSKFILDEIPVDKTIVSLHNNTAGDASIDQYLKGGVLYRAAHAAFRNPDMDASDFIITTDKAIFEALKDKKVNVVLQNNMVKDDGSLSIYCGRSHRAYVSIETQTGHSAAQENLMAAVDEVLK
ncbi:MAG: hypothetical protein JWP27_2501 [Flaviaesturariibacter sp.]|nr:hypothetical protein [Flaviaesturariibacter sp.]